MLRLAQTQGVSESAAVAAGYAERQIGSNGSRFTGRDCLAVYHAFYALSLLYKLAPRCASAPRAPTWQAVTVTLPRPCGPPKSYLAPSRLGESPGPGSDASSPPAGPSSSSRKGPSLHVTGTDTEPCPGPGLHRDRQVASGRA